MPRRHMRNVRVDPKALRATEEKVRRILDEDVVCKKHDCMSRLSDAVCFTSADQMSGFDGDVYVP